MRVSSTIDKLRSYACSQNFGSANNHLLDYELDIKKIYAGNTKLMFVSENDQH